MIERLERVISAIGFRISDVEDSGSWLLFFMHVDLLELS